MTERAPIVFFDGTCGFCNRSVRWILRHDRRGELLFAPLQGETYAALDMPGKPDDLRSMVVLDAGRLWTRSSGAVRTLRAMGGVWGWLGRALWIIPVPVRNLGYRLVAANRYRLAGRVEACEMPTSETRGRMLL